MVLVPTYPAALKFSVTLPSESEPRVYWPEVFVVLAARIALLPSTTCTVAPAMGEPIA